MPKAPAELTDITVRGLCIRLATNNARSPPVDVLQAILLVHILYRLVTDDIYKLPRRADGATTTPIFSRTFGYAERLTSRAFPMRTPSFNPNS